MIKLGILGLNEGNGHPFSYAAICNGYDPKELEKRCPYDLIKEYLPKEHKNENGLKDVQVTHIWTQDTKLSEDVAKVSLIPNIVDEYTDLIGKVDAVILARDDVENHLEMMKPFIENKVPLFIDKQLVATKDELEQLEKLIDPDYPLMAGSSTRFTRETVTARQTIKKEATTTIHGVSRESWMRYGHHLFESVASIWGLDIEWVRSLSAKNDHDTIQIHYHSGLEVLLEYCKDAHLPIQYTVYSSTSEPVTIPFTDYFHSFKEMLRAFVEMVKIGKQPIAYDEIVGISRVVLAGQISKEMNGVKIAPENLNPIDIQ